MICRDTFGTIETRLALGEYYTSDVAWSESVVAPTSAERFARETIFVICNSGMRFTVARKIYDKVLQALLNGESASTAFGHAGKCGAIDRIWRDREDLFEAYMLAEDKLAFLAGLPWIGGITKFHLAKNFGLDVVKPDVHLARLAIAHDTTPDLMCRGLAAMTGYRVATIDLLLWRACATGILDSRTGLLVG